MNGFTDKQDEVSSARRLFKELMGPSRKLSRKEILRRYERGWCLRDKKLEATQASLTLKSLEDGLNKCEAARKVAISRLGEKLFLECSDILRRDNKLLRVK